MEDELAVHRLWVAATAIDEQHAPAHPYPQQAHVRSDSASDLPLLLHLEESSSLPAPTADPPRLRPTPAPADPSRYPPAAELTNPEHPNPVFSSPSDSLLPSDHQPPHHHHQQQPQQQHRIPPSYLPRSNPYQDVADRPACQQRGAIQPFATTLPNQSIPPPPSSAPPPPPSPPHHPLSTPPSSGPSYHSPAHNSLENLLPHSPSSTPSSYYPHHHSTINNNIHNTRSGSPQHLPRRLLPLLPTHASPTHSPLASPTIVETPIMGHHFHRQDASQPPGNPAFNILSQYSPPLQPPQHHAPYLFGQPNSLLSSVDELKGSPHDEHTAAYTHVQEIPKGAGYPKAFDAPADPVARKSLNPRRTRNRQFLMIGYRRLAIITLAGLLLILAAVGIIVYTHLKRADHPPDVTGDSDGDVVGQSGLGSARNSSSSAGLDPFNATNSAFGPDNGLRGGINGYDSLVVFGASYCDNAHARPQSLHHSLKPPPYYKGRWSNGFVWNEYLSAIIGPGGRPTTLVNYAFGGATVDNALNEAPVPDLEQQVNAFLSDLSAQSAGAGPSNGKSLIAIWVGINSITKIWNSVLKQEVHARSQVDVQEISAKAQLNINTTVDHIFEVVTNLIHTTAFKAAVPDLLLLPIPPAQLLLVNLRAAKGNIGALRTLAALNDAFNGRFADKLLSFQSSLAPEQRVFTLDIPSIWHKFIEEPGSANLTVVDQPCLTKSGVCAAPGSYLFWDTLHPTTHVHEQLALMMASEIKR